MEASDLHVLLEEPVAKLIRDTVEKKEGLRKKEGEGLTKVEQEALRKEVEVLRAELKMREEEEELRKEEEGMRNTTKERRKQMQEEEEEEAAAVLVKEVADLKASLQGALSRLKKEEDGGGKGWGFRKEVGNLTAQRAKLKQDEEVEEDLLRRIHFLRSRIY